MYSSIGSQCPKQYNNTGNRFSITINPSNNINFTHVQFNNVYWSEIINFEF